MSDYEAPVRTTLCEELNGNKKWPLEYHPEGLSLCVREPYLWWRRASTVLEHKANNIVREATMLDFPRSLIEFQSRFPDEAACVAYLFTARWRHGFVCPPCGGSKA